MKKILAAVLFLFLATASACSPRSDEGESIQISIVTPQGATTYALAYMMENGVGLKGVKVQHEVVLGGDLLIARLLEGVDFAIAPINLAATLYNRDAGYQVAGVATWGNLFILTTDPEVHGWDDLSGRIVYSFGRGLVPDITFSILMERYNADPDLEFVPSSQEAAQKMLGGLAETALIAEPAATQVMLQTGARSVLDLQKEWGGEGFPQSVILVSQYLEKENPELVREILGEMEVSMKWINSNPLELAERMEALDGNLSGEIIKDSVQRLNIRYKDAHSAHRSIMDYLRQLYEMSPELIGGQVPGDGFIR